MSHLPTTEGLATSQNTSVLVVEGTLQRENGVTNVIVGQAAALERL